MIHHTIEANGLSLHFVEVGDGPAVLFCHGFPAIWSSWKHQMTAVARVGFRAIAPDMRGYGGSSAPIEAEAYTPFHTVGDLIAILDFLGVSTAVLVGHDFGANIAWNAAMMRPDRFTAVCGISVPFQAPGGVGFLDKLRAAGANQFYMFEQMKKESDQAWANAAITIPGVYYWTSGEAPEATCWDAFDPTRGLLRPAPTAPQTIDARYLADAVAAFAQNGFHGPLNYYRAIDPFVRQWAAYTGATVRQPSMFLAGAADGLNRVTQPREESLQRSLTGLRNYIILDRVGHWPQLEAPDATSEALLAFLQSL